MKGPVIKEDHAVAGPIEGGIRLGLFRSSGFGEDGEFDAIEGQRRIRGCWLNA